MQVQKSFAEHQEGTLYLVPTPIGNLDDMTVRAIDTLRSVDLIAAEDTRHTGQLLSHFGIDTRQISFHEHNTQQRIPELLDKLRAGANIAQVSDAGMPSISDPGTELVAAATAAGIAVVPLPGPNAGLTALIASGLAPQPFTFYGFLPRKATEQAATLANWLHHPATMIFYEAPHRLGKTLATMADVFGGDRRAVVARELTKKFEEFSRGTLAELQAVAANPRGEYVIMVAPGDGVQSGATDDAPTGTVIEQVQAIIDGGAAPNAAIKQVAKRLGIPRQDVYNEFHGID